MLVALFLVPVLLYYIILRIMTVTDNAALAFVINVKSAFFIAAMIGDIN